MKKIAVLLGVALAVGFATAPITTDFASATVKGPATYIPKPNTKCKAGYHKVTKHKVETVKGKHKSVAYAECDKTVPTPQVLQVTNGSGNGSLASFSVPSNAGGWSLWYSYNCANNFGGSGAFLVEITGGSQGGDIGPNGFGSGGSSVDYYHDSGSLSLQILSTCTWTVEVTTTNKAPTAPSNAVSPSTPATTTTTTTLPPVQHQTLLALSGSGTASTSQFTVPSNAPQWNLAWSYNCSNFGSSGNFIVDINGSLDLGVNQLGSSGSSTEHYFDKGTFSLAIISECTWSVTVSD